MANDYLISKWKLWFGTFDVNKDGQVDVKDVEAEKSKFIQLNHLEADKREAAMKGFAKWWNDYVFWGKSETTEADFVEDMNNAFKSDKGKFVDKMRQGFEDILKIIDVNDDGFISLDEWNTLFKAAGHDNKALDEKFFENYKPVDGKIPRDTLRESFVQFVTCEDSSKEDLVKAAIEAGV